jgi:hypothetical protein
LTAYDDFAAADRVAALAQKRPVVQFVAGGMLTGMGTPVFDSIGTFTKQFTPVEGGYLYYPSKKDGGKLVTSNEYDELVAGWQKVAGRKGIWKIVSIVMLTIMFSTLVSKATVLPAWSDSILTAACVVGILAWLLWASLAPRRLVRDRPAIAPPRPSSQVRRQARALINWRMIIFALFFSGIAFFGSLNLTPRDFVTWAWLIGSGGMFGAYIWIAIQKIRDR